MLVFMTPLFILDWQIMQYIFILGSFFFLRELRHFYFFEKLNIFIGLDLISYTLILLSFWICILIQGRRESLKSQEYFKDKFILILLFMLLFLFLRFSVLNFFLFYLFFERSLIPIFILIMGWGYQSERIQARIYLLLYTLFASLPLLIVLFYLYINFNSFKFETFKELIFNINLFILFGIYIGFMVKLPMFLFHLWLPKAHVEAPVAGSIILAGVLLKLGGYGLIRFFILLNCKVNQYRLYFIVIRLFGGVLISLNCLRQRDTKLLIAYSSVAHIGIIMAGIFTFRSWGLWRGLLMILSHGLCSSGLFFLVNTSYERISSRSMLLSKGLLHFIPKMALWWFLFCAINIAAPPSLNLLREIGLINSLICWSQINFAIIIFISFFSAGYSLYLFSFSQHGRASFILYRFCCNNIREYLILFLHWVPLNFLILNRNLLASWIYYDS